MSINELTKEATYYLFVRHIPCGANKIDVSKIENFKKLSNFYGLHQLMKNGVYLKTENNVVMLFCSYKTICTLFSEFFLCKNSCKYANNLPHDYVEKHFEAAKELDNEDDEIHL